MKLNAKFLLLISIAVFSVILLSLGENCNANDDVILMGSISKDTFQSKLKSSCYRK